MAVVLAEDVQGIQSDVIPPRKSQTNQVTQAKESNRVDSFVVCAMSSSACNDSLTMLSCMYYIGIE